MIEYRAYPNANTQKPTHIHDVILIAFKFNFAIILIIVYQ